MRSGWLPLAGWGVALLLDAALALVGFGLGWPSGLLAGAGAAAILAGGWAALAERRRPRAEHHGAEVVLAGSAASTVLAVGLCLTLVGAAVAGSAVLGAGAVLAVAGAGGVLRERRAARRLLEARR